MGKLTYERAKQLYAPYSADQMRHMCALRDIEIERLRDENAKLRELVKSAYRCANAGPDCLECRIVAGGCILLSAMRELGIEVGE